MILDEKATIGMDETLSEPVKRVNTKYQDNFEDRGSGDYGIPISSEKVLIQGQKRHFRKFWRNFGRIITQKFSDF